MDLCAGCADTRQGAVSPTCRGPGEASTVPALKPCPEGRAATHGGSRWGKAAKGRGAICIEARGCGWMCDLVGLGVWCDWSMRWREEAREAKPQGLVSLMPEVSQQGTGEPQEGCEQGGAGSTLGIERLSGAVGGLHGKLGRRLGSREKG